MNRPDVVTVRTKTGWAIYEKKDEPGRYGRLLALPANLREVRKFMAIYCQTLENEEEEC